MTVPYLPPLTDEIVDVVLPQHDGYPDDLAKLDTYPAMRGAVEEFAAVTDFPQSLYIEPARWKERAQMNDELGLWAGNFIDRYTHQGNSHECTSHALRCVGESCWNRQRRIALGGPQVEKRLPVSAESASVWFSCISIYAEANPKQWGGANCQQVCKIAAARGFLPDIIQPKDYGFKHFMCGTCGGHPTVNQSNGSWPGFSNGTFRNPPSGWIDSNWRETAKHFRPLEYVFPRSTEEFVCLLLHGYAIGVGRSGHSVPIIGVKYDGSKRYYPYFDSYNRTLYDSSAYYSGSYCILTMTQPDDWSKPAG